MMNTVEVIEKLAV